MTHSEKKLAILVGGGPAPGINSVISAVTIEARNAGLGVIGFVMLQSAKKKLEPSALSMERTQQSLRRDAEVVARRT